MTIIKEFKWHTLQPKGANQFHGSIIEWNRTLVHLLYKADAELLKDIVTKVSGYFEIKSSIKRKLIISPDLIDLIFIPEIYDSLIERFDIIINKDVETETIMLQTVFIEKYDGMIKIKIHKSNSPQLKYN